MSAQQVLVGWVRCASGRDELAAITVAQREHLEGGAIACPACTDACRPRFEPVPIPTDMRVVSFRDGRWQPGFALGTVR